MFRQILSPFSYLRINHGNKWKLDWLWPAVLAMITCALILKFGQNGAVGGKDGLADKLVIFCAALPGFFIAALAAIATFNKPDIDELMPDPAPRISIQIRGKDNQIPLTRRRFLAYLFSFLCAESIVVMTMCAFAPLIWPGLAGALPSSLASVLSAVFCFLLLYVFWQMIFATFLGLYYLGERLHQSAE